jgi:NDP-sugar pyrophosphorylase family protein
MPMAGEGSRFKEASYDVPKPLIQYKGIELYRRSLSSLSVSQYSDINVKYTFIVRKEFIDDYNIDKEINKYYPYANIITVDKTTRGALETIMLAEQYIDDEDCVVSMDCDIEFLCQGYVNKICEKLNFRSMYPMVLSFYSKNPIYSFVKVIGKNTGTFVAEKIPISTYALGGCYYLGLGKNLKKAAKKYIADFESGKIKIKELYLSEVINYIIDIIDGFIDVYDMDLHNDHYWSFGTPYDLENHKFEKNIWDE